MALTSVRRKFERYRCHLLSLSINAIVIVVIIIIHQPANFEMKENPKNSSMTGCVTITKYHKPLSLGRASFAQNSMLCVCVFMHLSIHECMHDGLMHVCTYVRMYECTYVRMHKHAWMHACTFYRGKNIIPVCHGVPLKDGHPARNIPNQTKKVSISQLGKLQPFPRLFVLIMPWHTTSGDLPIIKLSAAAGRCPAKKDIL